MSALFGAEVVPLAVCKSQQAQGLEGLGDFKHAGLDLQLFLMATDILYIL